MTQSTRTSAQQSSTTSPTESRSKTDPNQAMQDADLENELPGLESPTGQALQKLSANQQQNQVSAAAWGAIVAVVVKSTPESELEVRRMLEELQETLARVAEEKRKKSKDADANKEGILSGTSKLFGEKTAKAIQTTIDRIAIEQGGLPSKDPAALAKIAEQLAALLAKSDGAIKIPVSAQVLQKTLETELAVAVRSANTQPVKLSIVPPVATQAPTAVSIGKDLVAAARANPAGVAAYLQGKDGPGLLQSRLVAAKTVEERVQIVSNLKQALGAETFSAVLQSYDKRTGAPLAYDLVRLSQTTPEQQRAAVVRCFDSTPALFTQSERTRFITFTKATQALTLESVALEKTRIVGAISQLERRQAESVEHLSVALKAPTLRTVAPENVRAEILRTLAQQFPGLKDKSWEDVQKSLKDILSATRAEVIESKLSALGVAPAGALKDPAAAKQREDIKELLVIVSDHMAKIAEGEDRLKTLRSIEKNGQLGEVEKLSTSFNKITEGIFPEYSAERFATARTEARMYLENLSVRIGRARGSELAARCAERDGIEWRALQMRVQQHLKDSPAQIQRAVELINEFQLACGTGARGRGAAYLQAAKTLAGSFGVAGEYVAAASRVAQVALRDCAEKQEKLSKVVEEFKAQFKALDAQKDRYTRGGTEYWNQKYVELGTLQAARSHGDKGLDERIKKLEDEIANRGALSGVVGFFWENGDYAKIAIETARLERLRDLYQADLEAEEKRQQSVVALVKKIATENQSDLLRTFVDDGPDANAAVATAHKKLVDDFGALGATPKDIESLNAALKAVNAPRADVLAMQSDLKLAQGTSFVGSTSDRGGVGALSSGLQSAVGAKTGAELVGRIHACLTTDVTTQPSSQAIEALRSVVGRDSELGKQLSALAKSPSSQVLLEKLFARLSVEDVMRIKLFLLAYDRPEIMQQVPTGDDSERPALRNSQELWSHIETLSAQGERPELAIALSILPQIRSHQEVEAIFKRIPAAHIAEVLAEYERIAGCSLGQTLVGMAPPSGAFRMEYILSVLCGSSLVTERDLAPFFPNGVVPASIEARTKAMTELLAKDIKTPLEIAPEVNRCAQEQASERAMLLAALPVMTQLSRFDRVKEIEIRLVALDERFESVVTKSLGREAADRLARMGERARIEALRVAETTAAQAKVADPFGKLSREANRLVDIFEALGVEASKDPVADRSRRALAVADTIRSGNYSENETLMLEVLYAQHVSQRAGGTELQGDLRKDLAAFDGSGVLPPEHIASLLTGGEKLTSYDVERLSLGIRTHNGQLTVRAMVFLGGKEAVDAALNKIKEKTPEIVKGWNEFKETEAGKVAGQYYDAVAKNDKAKAAIIAVGSGLQTGAYKTIELAGAATSFVGACAGCGVEKGREIYRSVFGADIVDHAGSLYHGAGNLVSGVLSSDPVERGGALVRAGLDTAESHGIDLSLIRQGLDAVSSPEQRQQLLGELTTWIKELPEWAKGFPNSFTYVDGKGPMVLQYIRLAGGPLAASDALVVEELLKAPQDRKVSEEQLNKYMMQREQLQFQLTQAHLMLANRLDLHHKTAEVLRNVNEVHLGASLDRDGRVDWGFTIDQARRVTDVHDRMLASQTDLFNLHGLGLTDIRASAEIIRVRATVILKNTFKGSDVGLEVEEGTREVAALRQREAAREQVIVRKNDLREWETNGELEAKKLAKLDKKVEIFAAIAKTVAVVAVSCTPVGLVGAFLFATAWNGADKFLMKQRGVPLGEVYRQFLIELAFDAAFAGIGSRALGKVVGKAFDALGREVKTAAKFVVVESKNLAKTEAVVFKEGAEAAMGQAPKILPQLEGAISKQGNLAIKAAQEASKDVPFAGPLKELGKAEFKKILDGRWIFGFGPFVQGLGANPKPAPLVVRETPEPLILGAGPTVSKTPDVVTPDLVLTSKPPSKPQVEPTPPVVPPVAAPVVAPTKTPDVAPAHNSSEPVVAAPETPKNTSGVDAAIRAVLEFLKRIFGGDSPAPSSDVGPRPPPVTPPVEPPPADGPRGGPGPKPGLTHGPVVEKESPNGNAYTRASQTEGVPQVATTELKQAVGLSQPIDIKQQTPEPQQHKMPTAEGLQYFRRNALSQPVAVPQAGEIANEHLLALAERDKLAERNRNAQAEMNSQAAQNAKARAESNLQAAAHLQNHNSSATAQSAGHVSADLSQQAQVAARNATSAQTSHAVVEAEIIAPRKKPLSETLADMKAGKVEVIEATFHLVDGKPVAKGVVAVGGEANVASRENKKNVEVVAEQKAAAQAEIAAATKKAAEGSRKEAEESQQRVAQRVEAESVRSAALKGETVASSDAVAIQSRNQMAQLAQGAMDSQLTQAALAEAREREAVSASAVYSAVGAMASPLPRMKSSVVLEGPIVENSGSESNSSSSNKETQSVVGPSAASKKRTRTSAQRAARERSVIIQQLLTRSFDQSKREKLLRMLIALGISEKEYRELVLRVGQAETERMASAKQTRQAVAIEPLEVLPKSDVPTMKSSAPRRDASLAGKGSVRTRADLLAKLRNQA